MNSIALRLIFRIFDVIIIISVPKKDKCKKLETILDAFIKKFILGFITPNFNLNISFPMIKLILGFVMNLPSATITRIYLPIIRIETIAEIIIEFISYKIQSKCMMYNV